MASLNSDMTKNVKNARKEEKEREKAKKNAEKAKLLEKKKEKKHLEELREKEIKRKEDLAKNVKSVLAKIIKAYPNMTGHYINENGVEMSRDDKGNIMGIVDGFAFISDNEGTITFYSKPERKDDYYYYAPMRDDNYQCWFEYDKISAKLGAFKTYSVKGTDVVGKKAVVCEHFSCAPTQKEVDEVYNKLEYVKIESKLTEMRTQSSKR